MAIFGIYVRFLECNHFGLVVREIENLRKKKTELVKVGIGLPENVRERSPTVACCCFWTKGTGRQNVSLGPP